MQRLSATCRSGGVAIATGAGAVLLSVPTAALPANTETRALLNQCWRDDQLVAKSREIKPRSYAKGARVRPPKRSLAPFSEIPKGLQGVIRRVTVRDGRKLVALTFDLCEQGHEISGYDGRVVDTLRKMKIKATFFASGKWFLTHAERASQLIADSNFEIGNHGWRHRNMKALSPKIARGEILNTQRAYEQVHERFSKKVCVQKNQSAFEKLPRRIGLFRYPFGTCTPTTTRAVNDAGLLAIQWDISTGDPWRGQSSNAIVRTVMARVKPGSIVLAHANGRGWNTWRALPRLIERLKSRGYEFVTISELLASGTPEIVNRCYDQRIGDTDRWVRKTPRSKNKRAR